MIVALFQEKLKLRKIHYRHYRYFQVSCYSLNC